MKLTLVFATVVALSVPLVAGGQRAVNAHAATIADFKDRVYGYAALSKKLHATIK